MPLSALETLAESLKLLDLALENLRISARRLDIQTMTLSDLLSHLLETV